MIQLRRVWMEMLSWLFAQFSLQSIQMYLWKQLLQLTNTWMHTKVGLPETDNLFVRICSLVDVQVHLLFLAAGTFLL